MSQPETPRDSYAGKRVVVTGCASGIGERVAARLTDLGAEVVGLDIRAPGLKLHSFFEVDLARSETILAAAESCGEIDSLINVAGISGRVDPEHVIGINFVGTRELTDALVPRIRQGGTIAITASLAASRYLERRELIAGLLATTDRMAAAKWSRNHRMEIGTGYAISKDALLWYVLTSTSGLAARGIRINALAPGMTETSILEDVRESRGTAFLDSIPMPLGRTATAQEQADVLIFLCSAEASYLSGQIIWADGGYLAGVQVGLFPHVTGSVGERAPGSFAAH